MDAHGTDAPDRQHDDPDAFWLEAATAINWIRRPKQAGDRSSEPGTRWFPDGTLNTCYNAVDRHVINGRADDVALVLDNAVTGQTCSFTFAELLEQVAQCAGVLQALGVHQGDRVLIALPMGAESVVSMLACARIGAVHCAVRDDLTSAELATRIDEVRPAVTIAASWAVEDNHLVDHKPIVDAALERAAHRVEYRVIVQRPESRTTLTERDFDWAQVMKPGAVQSAGCVAVAATDPLSLQDVSGTGGPVKSMVQDNGGHAVALCWVMTHRHGMGPDDVWCSDLTVGWPRAQSAMVYAPLFVGATAVLAVGTPTGGPGALARLVERHRVTGLLITPGDLPTARQQLADTTPAAGGVVSSLRTLVVDESGRHDLAPENAPWVEEHRGSPAVTSWWPREDEWPVGVAPAGVGLEARLFAPGPDSSHRH